MKFQRTPTSQSFEINLRYTEDPEPGVKAIILRPPDYNPKFIKAVGCREGLGVLHFWYYSKGRSTDFENVNRQTPILWIGAFYVYYQTEAKFNALLSLQEKEDLRGIGKFMLCAAIKHLLFHVTVAPTTIVALEASGGYVKTNRFERMGPATLRRELQKQGFIVEKYIQMINAEFKELRGEIGMSPLVIASLKNHLGILEQHQKLVEYYSQYGLKPVKYSNGKHFFASFCQPLIGKFGVFVNNLEM